MAKYGTDKIKGHGIPEAMEAVLTSRSRIHAKVAILKPISAAIAIGTGGPFGAEGPIIQTGGAFGSLVGQLISTTAAERKVLLACGAGAGMAATFNAPIAGVILAIELLLFEFRARSFIPLVIATTLATSVRAVLLGQRSMFTMGNVDFDVLHGLPFYAMLGVICGGAAIGLTKLLYWVEDQFDRLPIDELWHPAIGSLAIGVIGFFVPADSGRGLRHGVGHSEQHNLAPEAACADCGTFKLVALVVSLGSGDFRRSAGANIHVEFGHGRRVRHRHEPPVAWGASGARGVRAGGNGRGIRRGFARYVRIYRFCLRDHSRLQRDSSLDAVLRDRGLDRAALSAHFDHD